MSRDREERRTTIPEGEMIRFRLAPCIAGLALRPAAALAGMPDMGAAVSTTVMSELPSVRLQAISFFLAGFLVSTLVVRWLWNGLRKDMPWLPLLSYAGALGLVTLWGLLFVLVLTMISGARELMTPGAWEPVGITSKLAHKAGPAPPDDAVESVRRERLGLLKELLWEYARNHEGRFPATQTDSAIPAPAWRVPGPVGMRYAYAGGAAILFDGVPFAYEPELFGDGRWVLFTDGSMRRLSSADLNRALAGRKKR